MALFKNDCCSIRVYFYLAQMQELIKTTKLLIKKSVIIRAFVQKKEFQTASNGSRYTSCHFLIN